MAKRRGRHAAGASAVLLLLLTACSGVDVEPPPDIGDPYDPRDRQMRERYGTIFGEDALLFSTTKRRREEGGGGAGIGVNAFLWRATLETLDFVPIASADPFGGLLITEWYQPQDAPNERFKLNVLIRDTVLRADAVKVAVFRQVRDENGDWLDAPVAPETARAIEDKILTKARELRVATLEATQ